MSVQGAHTRLVKELAGAHTIVTATETGLLTRLVEGGGRAADLADELQLDRDVVLRMLDVLASIGWATRGSGGWRASDWVGESQCGGLTVRRMSSVFRHLGTMARDGSVMMPGEVRHDSTGVAGLVDLVGDGPRRLADALPTVAGTIVDLGAGSATWSLAMAHGGARVIAVDRAEVLQAASARARELGLDDALELRAGSFWDVDLPPADRVVIANVVHLLDDESSRRLVQRAVEILNPGGQLVVVDVLGNDPPSPNIAAYALQLRLREPDGTVHSTEAICDWLRSAGLEDVWAMPLGLEAMELGAVFGSLPGIQGSA